MFAIVPRRQPSWNNSHLDFQDCDFRHDQNSLSRRNILELKIILCKSFIPKFRAKNKIFKNKISKILEFFSDRIWLTDFHITPIAKAVSITLLLAILIVIPFIAHWIVQSVISKDFICVEWWTTSEKIICPIDRAEKELF